MYPIQVILHPMDFFEHAQAAFSLACSLAREHKARLVVVHVVPPALTYHETAILVYGEEIRPGQAPLEHHKETQQVVRRAPCPVLTVKVPFVEARVPAEASRAWG